MTMRHSEYESLKAFHIPRAVLPVYAIRFYARYTTLVWYESVKSNVNKATLPQNSSTSSTTTVRYSYLNFTNTCTVLYVLYVEVNY